LRAKSIIYLGVLTVVALLSKWFLSSIESSLREHSVQDSEAPVLEIDDFQAMRMNSQGFREYTLRAPQLIQLPLQQGIRVKAPEVQVFRDGQILEWLVQSEYGWISPDYSLIKLEDEVIISRPTSSGEIPVVLKTRDLMVHPSQNYAETTAAVKAETPGGQITGIGLKAYLNEKTIELRSEVRGHYAPSMP
jgi:lipopolysaccharide export system protein LptC